MLIGLTGKPLCGKTTIADVLIAEHGFLRYRFGQPMREMLGALMRFRGADEVEIDRWLHVDKDQPCPWLDGQTARRGLQMLGENWANAFDPAIWVNSLRDALPRGARVVIDDVRRPVEAALARELGGVVLRVEREGGFRAAPEIMAAQAHAAENHDVPADATIDNSGSIEASVSAVLAYVDVRPLSSAPPGLMG